MWNEQSKREEMDQRIRWKWSVEVCSKEAIIYPYLVLGGV